MPVVQQTDGCDRWPIPYRAPITSADSGALMKPKD
jgi:hypothetical protein